MSELKSLQSEIIEKLEESLRLKRAVADSNAADIAAAVHLIVDSLKNNGKVIIFGNGGSAADAQHIAGELVGKLLLERQALPAICLNTNVSTLTALANDYGYDKVFSRQVEALVDKNDVVIGISTSGNSPNIDEAIKTAKTKGAKTIGLTGKNGGKLAKVADLAILVPSEVTPRIQEAHIAIGHIICEMVEKELAETDLNS